MLRDSSVKRSLQDVEKLLVDGGWCKGYYQDKGKHCLLGAVGKIAGADYGLENKLCMLLNAELPPGLSIISYNDRKNTRFRDIRRVIRKAINASHLPG